jgi:hypothetical protein
MITRRFAVSWFAGALSPEFLALPSRPVHEDRANSTDGGLADI